MICSYWHKKGGDKAFFEVVEGESSSLDGTAVDRRNPCGVLIFLRASLLLMLLLLQLYSLSLLVSSSLFCSALLLICCTLH